jgi:hypothetical protein
MTSIEPLRAFAGARIDAWAGVPPGTSIEAARACFGLTEGFEGWGWLGRAGHRASWESLDDRPLVLWHRKSELVLLDFEGPFDHVRNTGDLASPEARLDVHSGMATLRDAEWVYPVRGLAIVFTRDTGVALRLIGFASMTLDDYVAHVRHNPTPRPVALATGREPDMRVTP